MLQFDGLQSFCWGGSIQGDTPCLFQLVYKEVKQGMDVYTKSYHDWLVV